ncbi:MAG: DEAD/DEAH box helicase [Candidatus Altiarchaeota archaeon]
MLVSDLQLADNVKSIYLSEGLRELYPPQEAAVSSGLLDGGNMILSTPTASGKTFAAELAIAKTLSSGKKAVYIVPLRALAYEKSVEFRKYEKLGFSVRLEVGDLDAAKYSRKPRFDVLVATAEKADSIMRSRPEWFRDVGILILDEIHLIGSDRGPVYEIITTKLRTMYPDLRVIGLSATIGNSQELASWLSAQLVSSKWRPVELVEEVVVSQGFETMIEQVEKAVSSGGQVLVFVNSRRSAESVAEKIGEKMRFKAPGLEELSGELSGVLSSPTRQCLRLAGCVRNGAAFHHAGLVNAQRIRVEDAFREGLVKVIAATPTLAAGINLPSRTVIIRDLKRYGMEGQTYIPVFEYKQQAGRAGRPRYDSVGYAVSFAKTASEAEFAYEHYVYGESEPIYSRLGVEPVLRFHILAQIASGFTRTHEALSEFFRQTFYGFQYGIHAEFEDTLKRMVADLVKWGFVEEKERFILPTQLGTRVSELYIDPLTAHTYLDFFGKAEEKGRFPTIGLLEVLSDASEMPHLPVKTTEESGLWAQAYGLEGEFLRDIGGFDLDWEFLPRFKIAKLFMDWMREVGEDAILEQYNVAPGQLNQRQQIMEWLTYAASELARIKRLKASFLELKKLETRVKYGIREELIPLVSIKGVGRVRARKLFDSGLTSPEKLKKAGKTRLSKMLGEKTAENILGQL